MDFVLLVRAGLSVVAGYAVLGVGFAAAFHRRGLAALDPAARDTRLGFRIAITPGVVALWPAIAWRWYDRTRRGVAAPSAVPETFSPRGLRRAHAVLWKLLAVAAPWVLAACLYGRVR